MANGWVWRRHAIVAKAFHLFGIHDYMPTMLYDADEGKVTPMGAQCWICHNESGR